MANYSSKDLNFTIKDHGGTPRTIQAGIRSIGTVSVEALIQESTPFGTPWQTFVSTGIKKAAQFTIGGFYDDTATTGLDAMFSGFQGETRAGTIIAWGGTKTTTVDTIIVKYERMPKIDAETEVVITLQPTGTVTEV